MNMNDFIIRKCQSATFHLRSIYRACKYLTTDATISLIHAFVTSRLNYANSLLYGVPLAQLNRLQKIQNFAARVISKTHRFDLHWLPISKRIEFKILVHTFNSIHQTAPSHLTDVISPYTPSRTLRSSDGNLLTAKLSNTKYGQAAFQNAGPFLWNKLPSYIRNCDSLLDFKKHLKTHLFRISFT